MFQKLVSHNEDLRRLVEAGYAVGFDPGYLIVRDIPYLDATRQPQIGAIVSKLEFVDAEHVRQNDHQIFFAGGVPHNTDGTPIPNLGGGPTTLPLSHAHGDVVVQRSFSNKPRTTGAFRDFFQKIESYTAIISGPAMALFDVTPHTFRTTEAFPDSVFNFHDTMTSRAQIGDLSAKVAEDIVAVIGLGGTGAYLLDFLAKSAVREIRAFDHDSFHVHNAFRSPGRLVEAELGTPKSTVYGGRYENFRKGLSTKQVRIDASSSDELNGVTFAFVCVDKGSARAEIFSLLLERRIPFIDVGMGLNRKQESLKGLIRTTYYSAEHGEAVRAKEYAPLADHDDDQYRANIQISELNALNASLAIIKFKKVRGFYYDVDPLHHLLFDLADCTIGGEPEGA